MKKLPYTNRPDSNGILFLIIKLILIAKKIIVMIIARGTRTGKIAQITEIIRQAIMTFFKVCQVVLKKKKIGARMEA